MPRRATLTYSSEDAASGAAGGQEVHVYYCKYSGQHALTIDTNIFKLPRRRTDKAIVIDCNKYTVKLYTSDGGTKLIRRESGAIERQHRCNLGKLPVAYKSEPAGRYLYIFDNAVTAFALQEGASGGEVPVPPCILQLPDNTCQLALEVDDRGDKALLLKITADYVRLQITAAISNPEASEELVEFLRGVLGVRLSQLTLVRGESTRHKLLMVKHLAPPDVYEKLQQAMQSGHGFSAPEFQARAERAGKK